MDQDRPWRWVERDPFVQFIHCDEITWAEKAARRPELAAYEAEIRATVRSPDQVYYDPRPRPRPVGSPEAIIMHYYAFGWTRGKHAGTFISVIVKWLDEPATGRIRGYVQSMYFTNRILPRLQFWWSRQP